MIGIGVSIFKPKCKVGEQGVVKGYLVFGGGRISKEECFFLFLFWVSGVVAEKVKGGLPSIVLER